MREARWFAPAAIMLSGSLLLLGVRPQHAAPLEEPLRSMPIALANADGRDRDMTDQERKATAVTDYVFRTFGPDSATAFSLYVGYYQKQATGRSVHSPRNCLPGVGWQTVESGKADRGGGRPPDDGQPVHPGEREEPGAGVLLVPGAGPRRA